MKVGGFRRRASSRDLASACRKQIRTAPVVFSWPNDMEPANSWCWPTRLVFNRVADFLVDRGS